MKRGYAASAFVAGYVVVDLAVLLLNAATQTPDKRPSIFVLPMLGVLLCTLPANAGFAIGTFLQSAALPWKWCLGCGALVAIVIGAIASPVANQGDLATNGAFFAVFVVCAFLPKSVASLMGKR